MNTCGQVTLILGGFVLGMLLVPDSPTEALKELDLSGLVPQVPEVDAAAVSREVAELIRLKTVSDGDAPCHLPEEAQKELRRAHKLLEEFYPKLFAAAEREMVGEFTLLLKLQGTDKDMKSALVIGHLDVVGIEEGTEEHWGKAHNCSDCGPFSGKIKDGYVWGRGALDMKGFDVAFLHAAEMLMSRQQVGGDLGAQAVATLLEERGVVLEVLFDEGNPTLKKGSLSVNPEYNLAIIGTAEKGHANIRLSVEQDGGHASYPATTGTSASILAAAIHNVQRNSHKPRLAPPTSTLMRTIAPTMPKPQQFLAWRQWAFGPLLARLLLGKPKTAATVRTTTACTLMHAGVKDNVIPRFATANINHRIVPGDTVEAVLQRAIDNVADKRVKVELHRDGHNRDPTPVSRTDTYAYQAIVGAIRQTQKQPTVVSPALFIAGSDSKHYVALAGDRIYRYYPFVWDNEDLATIHATDERVRIADLVGAVRFFALFFLTVSAQEGTLPAIPLNNPPYRPTPPPL